MDAGQDRLWNVCGMTFGPDRQRRRDSGQSDQGLDKKTVKRAFFLMTMVMIMDLSVHELPAQRQEREAQKGEAEKNDREAGSS